MKTQKPRLVQKRKLEAICRAIASARDSVKAGPQSLAALRLQQRLGHLHLAALQMRNREYPRQSARMILAEKVGRLWNRTGCPLAHSYPKHAS